MTAVDGTEPVGVADRFYIIQTDRHGEPRWRVWDSTKNATTHRGQYTTRGSAEQELTRAMAAAS